MSLDTFETLKVDPTLFPKATPRVSVAKTVATSRPGVAPTTTKTRQQMLKDVMGAVVLVKTGDGSGTGFFVGPDGLLLTNAHVVEGATRVSVHTSEGESFLTTPVAVSSTHDLALLRINAKPKTSLRLGNSSEIAVGVDVIAIGNPLGLQSTVTKGIVSAIRKIDGEYHFTNRCGDQSWQQRRSITHRRRGGGGYQLLEGQSCRGRVAGVCNLHR